MLPVRTPGTSPEVCNSNMCATCPSIEFPDSSGFLRRAGVDRGPKAPSPGRSRFEQLLEQCLGRSRDRGAPSVVLEHHELAAECVGNESARLAAYEDAAEIVPGTVRSAAAVHVGVECSRRHQAQVEGGVPERPVLLPPQ